VIEGYWDDDFSRARNAGLVHVNATWALALDADDRVFADGRKLRRMLAGATRWDAYTVRVDNLLPEDEEILVNHSLRLFRPDRYRWVRAVHEQLEPRKGSDGSPLTRAGRTNRAPAAIVRVEHIGYSDPDAGVRRAERNVRLAQRQLDGLVAGGCADPDVAAHAAVDLGRSLLLARRPQEAVEALEACRELAPRSNHALIATDTLAWMLLRDGQNDPVVVLAEDLRANGADGHYCDFLIANARSGRGELTAALDLLGNIDRLVGPGGLEHSQDMIAQAIDRAWTTMAERRTEARDAVIEAIATDGLTALTPLLLTLSADMEAEDLAAQLRGHGDAHLPAVADELRAAGGPGPAVARALLDAPA
jgi:hypothetical protein